MNNYKHGDWYCKPANEAEAKEIVERALASGAELYKSVGEGTDKYRWNLREYWGVTNGHTMNTCYYDSRTYDAIYTIEQVREKFPLPSELQATVRPHFEHEQKEVVSSDVNVSVGSKPAQWDGKGWPPVGAYVMYTAVELEHNRSIIPNTWYKGRIIAYYDGAVWTSDNGIRLLSNTMFRPIKTEREQFVERVHDGYDGGAHHSTVMEIAGRIYDAIKSGNLKAPEADK